MEKSCSFYFNRNGKDVEEEIKILQATKEKQSHGLTVTEAIKNLSNPAVRRPFLVIVTNFTLVMWSGTFAIIFYAVNIFKDAGVDTSVHLAAIIVALVRVAAGVAGIFLIQKLPRRLLAIVSMTLMSLSMFILGGVLYCKAEYGDSQVLRILPIFCVALFMTSFAAGKKEFYFLLSIVNTQELDPCSGCL